MTKTKIDLDTVVTQTPGVVALDMDGEIVMMNSATGKYYALNAIGSSIWSLLSEPQTVANLRERLLTEYKVSVEVCQMQVLKFIDQMERTGIVTLG